MNIVLTAECSLCGAEKEYELNDQEQKIYEEYLVIGREMGLLQNLFPDIPAWIRSSCIDKGSGGFCICPKCNPFERSA